MKRFFMTAVAALMATMSVNAQEQGDWDYRTRLTANIATVTNNDDAKSKVGFGLNIATEYYVSKQVSIGLDLNSDRFGYKSKSLNERVNLDYIGFAPMVRYYATHWFMLEGGPQISLLTRARIDDKNVRDAYKKTEFSLPIGFAFEPRLNDDNLRLSIGLRYRLGISKINKEGDAHRNSVFMLTAGVAGW